MEEFSELTHSEAEIIRKFEWGILHEQLIFLGGEVSTIGLEEASMYRIMRYLEEYGIQVVEGQILTTVFCRSSRWLQAEVSLG